MRENNNLQISVMCRVCGNNSRFFTISDYLSKVDLLSNRKVVQCGNCNVRAAWPYLIDDHLELINKNYWSEFQDGKSVLYRYLVEAQMISRIDWIEDAKWGVVLDVGSGYGELKKQLNKKKISCIYYAVEYDQTCWPEIKSYGSEDVTAELSHFQRDFFDFIFCSHALEHMNDPSTFIRNLFILLNDDGYIFIEVPNRDDEYKLDFGTHLFFYSPNTLKILLEDNGFSVIKLSTVGRPINELMVKIHNKSTKYFKIRDISKNILKTLYYPIRQLIDKIRLSPEKVATKWDIEKEGDNRQWIRCLARKRS